MSWDLFYQYSIRVVPYLMTGDITIVIENLAFNKNLGFYPMRGWTEKRPSDRKTSGEGMRMILKKNRPTEK